MNDFLQGRKPVVGTKRVVIYFGQSDMSGIVLRGGSWNLSKRLGAETFSFTMIAPDAGIRPMMNGEVIAYHGTDLLFGGTIKSAVHSLVGSDGDSRWATAWDVECRGFESIMDEIVLTGGVQKGPLYEVVYKGFYEFILSLKGVEWLGPTTGGPMMQTDVTYVRSKLSDILAQIGKQTNSIPRINGEKQFAMQVPGGLQGPVYPLTGAYLIKGSVSVKEVAYEVATRLILQTGGTGEADHSETHIADGIKSSFLLNVEPKLATKKTENGVDTWTYYFPTKVFINDVEKPLDGSQGWHYVSEEHAVETTDDSAPPAGTRIRVPYKIGFPATVRVWLPTALWPAGTWNYGTIKDKIINVGHIADVSQAKAWGDVELQRRAVMPVVLQGSTRMKGWYPLLNTHVDIPDMQIWDNFLVQNVNINDGGEDTIHNLESLVYQLEMIQGGTVGRQYEELYKEFISGGTSGGQVTSGSGSQAGSSGGIGGGGTVNGMTSLPVGFTFHLGGDNGLLMNADTTPRDIPQMIPQRFGGVGMGGTWMLKIFGYIVTGTGLLTISVDAGGSELAVAQIDGHGAMLVGPWDAAQAECGTPPSAVDIRTSYTLTGGPGQVIIGHCTLQKIADPAEVVT